MPVQVNSISKGAQLLDANTSDMYDNSHITSSEPHYQLDGLEKTRLEEILDMCADYERQIEAEQREALRLRQNGSPSNITSPRNNNVNDSNNTRSPRSGMSPDKPNYTQKHLPTSIISSHENGVNLPPSNPNLVTATSSVGNQWSPGGTMLTPNR